MHRMHSFILPNFYQIKLLLKTGALCSALPLLEIQLNWVLIINLDYALRRVDGVVDQHRTIRVVC